jgi:glycosyltransferase involved in cell wall biosynthesis
VPADGECTLTRVATRYSVVVPVLDEAGVLEEFYRRVSEVLDSLDGPWELIFVDDGSRDGSYKTMRALRDADPRVKIISFSRNFGHQVAITAGVDRASGEAVIVMDADLQHPPEVIPQLVERWGQGYEIVYGEMAARASDETRFKRWTAPAFYRLLGWLSDVDVPPAGDLRLVDRKAVDAFKSLRERSRYVRGMFGWIGFRQTGVPYTPAPRSSGRSKYTLSRMMRLATHGVLGFSRTPLRAALFLGFVVSILAIAEAMYAVVDKVGGFDTAPGWTSIVFVVSILGGIQLIVLGVIGEYVGLIHEEVKQRPIYVSRDEHGFGGEP